MPLLGVLMGSESQLVERRSTFDVTARLAFGLVAYRCNWRVERDGDVAQHSSRGLTTYRRAGARVMGMHQNYRSALDV